MRFGWVLEKYPELPASSWWWEDFNGIRGWRGWVRCSDGSRFMTMWCGFCFVGLYWFMNWGMGIALVLVFVFVFLGGDEVAGWCRQSVCVSVCVRGLCNCVGLWIEGWVCVSFGFGLFASSLCFQDDDGLSNWKVSLFLANGSMDHHEQQPNEPDLGILFLVLRDLIFWEEGKSFELKGKVLMNYIKNIRRNIIHPEGFGYILCWWMIWGFVFLLVLC